MVVHDDGVPSSSNGTDPWAPRTVPLSYMEIMSDATFLPTAPVRKDLLLVISSPSDAWPMASCASRPETMGSDMTVRLPDGALSALRVSIASLAVTLPSSSRSASLTTSYPSVLSGPS